MDCCEKKDGGSGMGCREGPAIRMSRDEKGGAARMGCCELRGWAERMGCCEKEAGEAKPREEHDPA